eukprot:gene2063-18836_t
MDTLTGVAKMLEKEEGGSSPALQDLLADLAAMGGIGGAMSPKENLGVQPRSLGAVAPLKQPTFSKKLCGASLADLMWTKGSPQDFSRAYDNSKCGGCGKPPAKGKKLMMCSRCKCANYCSAECQKAMWKAHKRNSCSSEEQRIERVAKALVMTKTEPMPSEALIKAALKASQQQVKLTRFLLSMLVDGFHVKYTPEEVCGAIKLYWGLTVTPEAITELEATDTAIAAALAKKRDGGSSGSSGGAAAP